MTARAEVSTGWQDRAACRGKPYEWFHPGSSQSYVYDQARVVCASCEVSDDCLSYILGVESHGQRNGMWAGLTPDQRTQMMRGRRRTVTCVWCKGLFRTRSSHPSKTCSTECYARWQSLRKGESRRRLDLERAHA